jgi:type IV pilus assembly protein PilY1
MLIYIFILLAGKKWYKCVEVNSTKTACTTYDLDNTIAAPNTAGMTKVTNCSIPGSDTKGECYKVTGMVTLANSYSGFNDSVSTSKKTDLLSYSSPLPAAVDRVSCDGQGVYGLMVKQIQCLTQQHLGIL